MKTKKKTILTIIVCIVTLALIWSLPGFGVIAAAAMLILWAYKKACNTPFITFKKKHK